MEFLLKPGNFIARKVLYTIKIRFILLGVLSLSLILSSCNLSSYYVSALDLTATAVFATALDNASNDFNATQAPPVIAEPTPVFVNPTAIAEIKPAPTETTLPILQEDPIPTATRDSEERPPILYYTQSGDTLNVIASRFGVAVDEIKTQTEIFERELIKPQTLLVIPDYYGFDIASDPV